MGTLLHKPEKVLGHSISLKFAKKAGHKKASPVSDLNVTPMVDMLTMLVIFLLMSFTASGELLFVTQDIILPNAMNTADLQRAPVIAISAKSIAMEGESIMRTEDVSEKWYPDWRLPPLVRKLKQTAKEFKEMNPDKPFEGQVIIQSDGNVPCAVIKMVMTSCADAGYMNVNFAVQKGARIQPQG
ncbi:MAG: biopolymer transporter ExbD [Deltaproteobacteria bacterium]|nr:biopolymer transporter ExbD [Deltaproteobacteria bacterium]